MSESTARDRQIESHLECVEEGGRNGAFTRHDRPDRNGAASHARGQDRRDRAPRTCDASCQPDATARGGERGSCGQRSEQRRRRPGNRNTTALRRTWRRGGEGTVPPAGLGGVQPVIKVGPGAPSGAVPQPQMAPVITVHPHNSAPNTAARGDKRQKTRE